MIYDNERYETFKVMTLNYPSAASQFNFSRQLEKLYC